MLILVDHHNFFIVWGPLLNYKLLEDKEDFVLCLFFIAVLDIVSDTWLILQQSISKGPSAKLLDLIAATTT